MGGANSLQKVLDGHGGIPKALKTHPKREGPVVFRDQSCQNVDKKQQVSFFFKS